MKNINGFNNCCGCAACFNICPKKCIKMEEDSEGFLIPVADEKACISCGECIRVCPQMKDIELNKVRKTFAAVNKKHDVLLNSSSGGAMSAIASVVLEKGGYVYGVRLNTDSWNAEYTRIENKDDLGKIRGSKYFQADVNDAYIEVKRTLADGRTVLFIGTPCQVSGLYSFLGNHNTQKLYTIDLVCHGVSSRRLFRQYIETLEKKYKKTLKNFQFRGKSKFPNKAALKYVFENKEKYVIGKCEPYFMQFYRGVSYRRSCYSCKYAQADRVGDITLADFWGIEKVHKDFDNTYGSSLILVNTDRAERLVNEAELRKIESDVRLAIPFNHNLSAPTVKHSCRENFYREVDELGIDKAIRKSVAIKPSVYNFILNCLPKKIINQLAKMK